ncbi:two-component regulator propeller domain-containing protein [Rufibacter roseolus]|uniref:two-component regulator propeller domain-containing protein n=1 Tax=Rufibacter roseolus TaxID=2817375 RepID=UPI001B309065|nr:two-component regulator propeller domain-containing protein [Rufibacter roseolus]
MKIDFYYSYRYLLIALLLLTGFQVSAQDTLNVQVYNQANTPGFPTANFQRIEVDGKGHVWLGANGQGLIKFNPFTKAADSITFTAFPTHQVRAIAKDQKGDIWFASGTGGVQATGGAIRKFTKGSMDSLTSYNIVGAEFPIVSRYVNGLAAGPGNTMWAAHGQTLTSNVTTEGGIGRFDGTRWHKIIIGLPSSDRRVLTIGKVGEKMWAGVDRSCFNGACVAPYIAEYSDKGEFIRNVPSGLPFSDAAGAPLPRAIFSDSKGRVWVGLSTGAGVVAVFENETWTVINNSTNRLPANTAVNFNSVREDKSGNIWIGTSNGLLRFSGYSYTDLASWTLYTTDHKLPSNFITGIAFWEEDMWLSTSAGLARVMSNLTISGVVHNIDAFTPTGNIVERNLAGAKVKLLKHLTTQVIDSTETDADGKFKFDPSKLEAGVSYSVQVFMKGSTLEHEVTINDLKPTISPVTIKFPLALKEQLYKTLTQNLKEFEYKWKFADAELFTGKIDGYNTSELEQLISKGKWHKVKDHQEEALEGMLRTLLALHMVEEHYKESDQLVNKTVESILDVFLFLAKSIDNHKKDVELPTQFKVKKLKWPFSATLTTSSQKILKYVYNSWYKESIKHRITSIEDLATKNALLVALDQAELLLFEDVAADYVERRFKEIFVNLGSKSLQKDYYIHNTQKFVDDAYWDGSTNDLRNGFTGAATDAYKILNETKEANLQALEEGQLAQDLSSTWGDAGSVGEFWKAFSTSAKVASFAAAAGAVIIYNHRYFDLVDRLEQPYERSYSSERQANAISRRSRTISVEELQAYNSQLGVLRNSVVSKNFKAIEKEYKKLEALENRIDQSIKEIKFALSAAIPQGEKLDGFDGVYTQTFSLFNKNIASRIAFEYSTHQFFSDTLDASQGAELIKMIDSLVVSNNSLKKIGNPLAILSGVRVPASIYLKSVTIPDSIRYNSDFQIILHYKNFGSAESEPFDIILSHSPELGLSSDSVRLEGLASDEEASLTLNVKAGDLSSNPYIRAYFKTPLPNLENIIFKVSSAVLTKDALAKQDQTLTFAVIPAKTVGDAPFALTATASSGLPISYSVVSGPARIEGNMVTITGEGTVTVKAKQEGNEGFNSAPEVTVSFCVVPAKPVITQSGTMLTSSSATGNQWYLNGSIIPGATSNTLTLQQSGIYAVRIIGSCGTSEMSTAVTYNITGLEEELSKHFRIYPNPTQNNLSVEIHDNLKLNRLTIYSIQGKIVTEIKESRKGFISLTLGHLEKGLYIMRLDTNKGVLYKKIVLE